MDTQQLIIDMAEKLHRQDPTKTDEYNWLTAETIINAMAEIDTLKAQVEYLNKALDEKVINNNFGSQYFKQGLKHMNSFEMQMKYLIHQVSCMAEEVETLWEERQERAAKENKGGKNYY